MEWARTTSKPYYDSTMRWIEDTYLKYFGENRTSYGAKGIVTHSKIMFEYDLMNLQRNATQGGNLRE